MSILDQSAPVRRGEELNLAALESYLVAHLAGARGPLLVEQFPSGFSNLTYLLRLGERELVLRRPPFGANIKSAHDMGREHRVLRALHQVYPKVPQTLLYCEDERVLGAPFYVMERLHGVILRGQPLPTLDLSPAAMHAIAVAVVDNLAAIHAVDYQAAGLGDLGRPAGYVERQIQGWHRRYRSAQTDELVSIEQLIDWLSGHLPADSGTTLIHNDYKFDNLMLNPAHLSEIIAVLDWEMCTLGDPLMDLGTPLGYWIEPGDPPALQALLGLTTLPGNLTRQQVVDRYTAVSSRPVNDPLFYYLYGLFKIAVIVQQIYARYQRGHTQDRRFAGLIEVVRACGSLAAAALARGTLSERKGR